MNGRSVTDQDDARAMRQYILHCIEGYGGLHMLPHMGMDGYSNPTGHLLGYISCNEMR